MPIPTRFRVERHASLPSTQDRMRERLAAGRAEPGLVIRAGQQTAGRGRRARDWSSPPGGSYQTALVTAPHAPPGLIPLGLALGVAETLEAFVPGAGESPRLRVKWPNDLLLGGGKLAGVLAERQGDRLLIGVGVNVRNPVPEGARGLPACDPEAVGDAVLAGLERGLELLGRGEVVTVFRSRDYLRGRLVSVVRNGVPVHGIAEGISAMGCLRVRQERDTILACSGHVAYVGAKGSSG